VFFEARDSLNYFFTFRWLLIHFKREFTFAQVEVLGGGTSAVIEGVIDGRQW